ncbi:DUF4240 domain-containing protein [Dactylosporangium sp. CA-139066]|uniref:DUF4240 domain-containing protein n=1 Tax=Dactylosporangium sp. CA-139066 TaxID=3239930 RepID=UPI003D8A0B3E
MSDERGFPSGSAIGAVLVERLARMPLERIVAFDVCRAKVVGRVHQWGVCAATFVVWKYLSDDTFSDFKAGLLGLGRDAFERVVAVPDALADVPVIQAIAAGQVDRFALHGEAIGAAAAEAYERRTDDADAFWEALEALPAEAFRGQERSAVQKTLSGFRSSFLGCTRCSTHQCGDGLRRTRHLRPGRTPAASRPMNWSPCSAPTA